MSEDKNTLSLEDIKLLILPIVFSIIFSGILVYFASSTQLAEAGVFFSEAEGGIMSAVLNAIFYLVVALIGGFLIYFLLVKVGVDFLKILLGILMFVSLDIILIMYLGISVYSTFQPNLITFVVTGIITTFIAFILVYLIIFHKSEVLKNAAILIYCSFAAVFIALIIPTWSVILMLLCLAVYDIYSVKKGPIKKSIEHSDNAISELNLTYRSEKIEIGIGDMIFYNVLPAHVLAFFDLLMFVIVSITIILGVFITLKILPRLKFMPGLPISIFLSTTSVLIYLLIVTFLS
ncbi:MAG: hypothetical protein ACTSSJ_05610 [Candidatus Odinarchaeia archaeon]